MKEYNFEYTKESSIYLLFGLSFIFIGLGLFLFRILLKNSVSPALAVIATIGISVVFFVLNKHRIKRLGSAKLDIDHLTIELNEITRVVFNDLKYYYVHDGKNLIALSLGFKDGTKFILGANNNFCNQDSFRALLADFQLNVEAYNIQNNAKIIQLESTFARKRSLYILSTLTALVIIGFYFTQMPLMILPIGVSFGLLGGWIRYFQLRSKNKLVDF